MKDMKLYDIDSGELCELIDSKRIELRNKNKDYKKLRNKVCEIKENYPNILALIEDNEVENLDKEECIKVKHKDLKKYDSKYSENIIALDNYQKAVEELQTIDEISINEQDLKKVIEFLERKEKTNDLNLEFYTVQELDQEVENITNEIYKFISLH